MKILFILLLIKKYLAGIHNVSIILIFSIYTDNTENIVRLK